MEPKGELVASSLAGHLESSSQSVRFSGSKPMVVSFRPLRIGLGDPFQMVLFSGG